MELDWGLLCNSVEVKPGGLLVLDGVQWDTAWSLDYPAGFAGYVVLRFLFSPDDLGSRFLVELRFAKHEGAEIARPMLTEVVPPTPPSDWEAGSSVVASNVVLGFAGLPVQEPGRYEIRAVHQGQVLKTIPFWARKGTGPSAVIT